MLEQYFLKPETVDQIRSSWLAEPIERYVKSLSSQGYPPSYIRPRVPILRQFAQFAWSRGARTFEELPEHVEPFVAHRTAGREAGRSAARARRRRHLWRLRPDTIEGENGATTNRCSNGCDRCKRYVPLDARSSCETRTLGGHGHIIRAGT